MARKATSSSCPITASPRVRLASEAQTSSIKDQFPPGIAQPALRALYAAGFQSLEQLTTISRKELASLHGMGPKAIAVLHRALRMQGLDFRQPSEAGGV